MGIGLINTHFLPLAHPIRSQAWLERMGERQTRVGSQIQESKEDKQCRELGRGGKGAEPWQGWMA